MNITKSINNESNPKRNLSDIKFPLLHHTGTDRGDSQNFLNKDDYISAHYLIKKSGEIVQLMDLDRIAYHAGASSWKGVKSKGNSLNWCTIGIEIEGYLEYTDAQRASTEWLVLSIIKKFKVPPELILRHKDVAPERKIDIHDNFWNSQFASWKEYVNYIYTKKILMDKYRKIMEEEVPENERLLKNHEGDGFMTEGECKCLNEIIINRALKSLKKN